MKLRRFVYVLLVLVLALSACGGGGGGTKFTKAAQSALAKWEATGITNYRITVLDEDPTSKSRATVLFRDGAVIDATWVRNIDDPNAVPEPLDATAAKTYTVPGLIEWVQEPGVKEAKFDDEKGYPTYIKRHITTVEPPVDRVIQVLAFKELPKSETARAIPPAPNAAQATELRTYITNAIVDRHPELGLPRFLSWQAVPGTVGYTRYDTPNPPVTIFLWWAEPEKGYPVSLWAYPTGRRVLWDAVVFLTGEVKEVGYVEWKEGNPPLGSPEEARDLALAHLQKAYPDKVPSGLAWKEGTKPDAAPGSDARLYESGDWHVEVNWVLGAIPLFDVSVVGPGGSWFLTVHPTGAVYER